jgi:hypothetical protein
MPLRVWPDLRKIMQSPRSVPFYRKIQKAHSRDRSALDHSSGCGHHFFVSKIFLAHAFIGRAFCYRRVRDITSFV